LLHAVSILSGVEGLYFAWLHTADIVRNPLIKKIIRAYDEHAQAGSGGVVPSTSGPLRPAGGQCPQSEEMNEKAT
jgi:hypothetical protein